MPVPGMPEHGPQPVRLVGLAAGPRNNTHQLSVNCDSEVYFALLPRWCHPARLGLNHTLWRAIRPLSFDGVARLPEGRCSTGASR